MKTILLNIALFFTRFYRKNLSVICFIIFISGVSKAQTFQWGQQIGGTSSAFFSCVVNDLIVAENGDVYVGGHFTGTVNFNPNGAVMNKTATGSDGFVAKYDAGGNLSWIYTTGGISNEEVRAINVFSDGTALRVSMAVQLNNNAFNLRSVADADGILIDQTPTYTSTSTVQIEGMNSSNGLLSHNAFCVTGSFSGTLTVGNKVMASNGGTDIFYASFQTYNADWFLFSGATSVGSPGNDAGLDIEIRNSCPVIVGYFEQTVDFDTSSNTNAKTSAGGKDGFIWTVDPYLGSFRQITAIQGWGHDFITSISIPSPSSSTQNIIYVSGNFTGAADFDPSTTNTETLTSTGEEDGFIAKYTTLTNATSDFTLSWAKKFGGAYSDYVPKVFAPTATGNVYFTANVSNSSFGGIAPFIGAYNSTGTQISSIGGILLPTANTSLNYSRAISANNNGDIYSGGIFNSTSINLNPNNAPSANKTSIGTGNNAYLIKLGSCISASTPTVSQITNPNGSVTLSISSGQLNGNNNWVWYKGNCGGTLAGTGSNITISSPGGTTYYARGEGGCAANGICSTAQNINVVLPVTLLSFTTQKQLNNVFIEWKTTSEINNDYFKIQHSLDGKNFNYLAIIHPSSTDGIKSYSYQHNNPANTTNYYRLLQFDKDGNLNDLGIKVEDMSIKNSNDFIVYPNPATTEITIDFKAKKFSEVKLFDITGKSVKTLNPNSNQQTLTINLEGVLPGIYILHLSGARETVSQRIFIK